MVPRGDPHPRSLAGPPVLAIRAAVDGDELYVSDNEADRLIAEELLPEDAARVIRVPWFEPLDRGRRAGVPRPRPTSRPRCAPPARAFCPPRPSATAPSAVTSPRR